jgi:predicted Zn-dependent peptidase
LNATQTRPAAVESALSEWFNVLRGLRGAEPVTPAVLDAAQQSRVGALPVKIDGPDSVATRLVEIVRDGLPLDYFNRYAAGVSATTPASVAAAAKKYIDLDHLAIVVTGDRRIIEPALRAAKIAPVVIVDQRGRPIEE